MATLFERQWVEFCFQHSARDAGHRVAWVWLPCNGAEVCLIVAFGPEALYFDFHFFILGLLSYRNECGLCTLSLISFIVIHRWSCIASGFWWNGSPTWLDGYHEINSLQSHTFLNENLRVIDILLASTFTATRGILCVTEWGCSTLKQHQPVPCGLLSVLAMVNFACVADCWQVLLLA